ncbi:MAG: hypothetical protein KAH03_03485 [Cocleimonas sp.]|nr:hypothetical protein [Cocleimonas sp.]
MSIKLLCTLIIFSLVLTSAPSFARKPTLSSLNYAISGLKRKNNILEKRLKTQRGRQEKQDLNFQDILKQQIQQNEQTKQQFQQDLDNLKQQLQTQNNKKLADDNLLYLLAALSTLALGLSVFSLLLVRRKPEPETLELTPRIEQTEVDIIKLSGQSAQHSHEVASLKATHGELFKGFSHKLNKLDNERKQSYERRQSVEKELGLLLQQPVAYEATEADRLVLSTMLEEENLNFEETLKAKSLVAEYQGQWRLAIVYWETLLAENENNTLALLHVGYSNYKLAENHRDDDYYLTNATNTYSKIMQLAPEYFEDINAYDDDENMGASELVNDPDKVIIYQQIEQLIMKADELKNYYSIYNLACQYAKEGKMEEAKDWLEQIALESNTLHCKHLRDDKDLKSIRDLPWFQRLMTESCEESFKKKTKHQD